MAGAAMLYRHSGITPNPLTNMSLSAPTGKFREFLHFCLVPIGFSTVDTSQLRGRDKQEWG